MMNVNNLSGEALQTILYDSSSALVSSIKSTGEQLDGAISSIMVRQGVEVGVVNDLLFNIDALNKQLPSQDKFQQNAILDQRQGLVEQLNRYTGTQIVLDESTKRITIFSDKGDTLLSDKATVFNAFMTASGSIGADNQLTADTIGYKKELADVYNDAATRVNNIMTAGTLNDGSPGVPIFSLTVDPSKASLAISDKSKIASKYPQTVDANPVITSMSIIEAKAGLQTKSHQDSYQLTNQYLESLKQEKQNTAGVSLENEALKMMQLQNMYEANLKMFSVVDSMMKDTINIIQ
jgi:flagellar hook-associated protein FlgK